MKSDFSPKFNAFEEYIPTLPPWNGTTDHIYRLATSVTVKDDQDYFRTVLKKWMVAFIAAIFDPEEVNHEILVFICRQGNYKSTWFHYLLPPELRHYFLPKLMSNSSITKDDLFKIAQSGLVCFEEIDNMKQRDLNQLKALTTMRTINERRSYGEFNEYHCHIASFCGTGNNARFLTDLTGTGRKDPLHSIDLGGRRPLDPHQLRALRPEMSGHRMMPSTKSCCAVEPTTAQ